MQRSQKKEGEMRLWLNKLTDAKNRNDMVGKHIRLVIGLTARLAHVYRHLSGLLNGACITDLRILKSLSINSSLPLRQFLVHKQ